jgi:hypothetical protein
MPPTPLSRHAVPHSPPPPPPPMPKDLRPQRRLLQGGKIIEISFSSGKIWNLGRGRPVETVSKASHMPKSQRDALASGARSEPALSRPPKTGRFQTRRYKAYVSSPNETRYHSQFSCTVRVGRGLHPIVSLSGGLHVRTVHLRFSILGCSKNYLEERSHTAEQ